MTATNKFIYKATKHTPKITIFIHINQIQQLLKEIFKFIAYILIIKYFLLTVKCFILKKKSNNFNFYVSILQIKCYTL